MDLIDLVLFIGGLALLVVGAKSLVRGATRLGRLAGLSPLVIGLTIVSFATTAPEASVSISAASQDRGGLAVGNVLGSNIFNLLVVAGAAAAVISIPIDRMTLVKDIPVLIIATAVIYLLALNRSLVEWEGALLLTALVCFVSYSVWRSRRDARATRESLVTRTRRQALTEFFFGIGTSAVGVVLLVFGSQLFVDSASNIASALGVSELIIGLTIVSAGTSAPELTTSLVAAFRGETELAIGNAIGASLINLMGVLGIAAVVSGGGLAVPENALRIDFPIALSIALIALYVAVGGRRATRGEGLFMLGFYAAYLVILIAASINEDLFIPFGWAVRVIVLPVSALAAALMVWRTLFSGRPRRLEVPFIDR